MEFATYTLTKDNPSAQWNRLQSDGELDREEDRSDILIQLPGVMNEVRNGTWIDDDLSR